MPKRVAKQLSFRAVDQATAAQRKAEREALRRRGGRPKKPAAERGVPHAPRPVHSYRHPVHVTVRVAAGMPSLRHRKVWRTVRTVLLAAAARFRQMFRIVEYSVQSNHVHLVVEAHDRRELSRGMQGFGIRLAKNLNLRLERTGKVFQDRYHAHPLRSPTETLRALRYVRQNTHLHAWRENRPAAWTPDPCSTDHPPARAALPEAESFLLTRARAAAG
jgi:REP element-mobilizing transposase RayT